MNLVLGTVQFGLSYGINNRIGKPSQNAVFEILDAAWENGIDTLDTADAYGNAIQLIGAYHKVNGRLFKINTKFKNIDISSIKDKLLLDIQELRCEKINALFFHSFNEYMQSGAGLLELIRARAERLIVSIGVSVYTNEELAIVLNDPEIDIIQLPYNLLDNDFQRGVLLKLAKEKGKKIQVRSVFLQGLFFIESKAIPQKLEMLKPWLELVKSITAASDITLESLCLLYPNAQDYIDEIIIGVDTKEQLFKNLDSLNSNLPNTIKNTIDQIAVTPSFILYPPNWV